MGAQKIATRFKLLDAAMRIIANDVHRNVRDSGPYDDAEDEYADEQLVVAASDFLDAWREPRSVGKEQRVLEDIESILSRGGSVTNADIFDRLENARGRIRMRISEIKSEQDGEALMEHTRRQEFLGELARSFSGVTGRTYPREGEDVAMFAMETTRLIELRTIEKISQQLRDGDFRVAAAFVEDKNISGAD